LAQGEDWGPPEDSHDWAIKPLTLGDDRYALHDMHPEIAVKQLMGDKRATTVK
jgi:hypothetical protein